jgi:hypothetical protein
MTTEQKFIALLNNPEFGGSDSFEFRGKTDSLDNWSKKILGLRVERHNQIIALSWSNEKAQYDFKQSIGMANLAILMENDIIGYQIIRPEGDPVFRGFPGMKEDAKALYKTVIKITIAARKHYEAKQKERLDACDYKPSI